jgi:hypothetical protein
VVVVAEAQVQHGAAVGIVGLGPGRARFHEPAGEPQHALDILVFHPGQHRAPGRAGVDERLARPLPQ